MGTLPFRWLVSIALEQQFMLSVESQRRKQTEQNSTERDVTDIDVEFHFYSATKFYVYRISERGGSASMFPGRTIPLAP